MINRYLKIGDCGLNLYWVVFFIKAIEFEELEFIITLKLRAVPKQCCSLGNDNYYIFASVNLCACMAE